MTDHDVADPDPTLTEMLRSLMPLAATLGFEGLDGSAAEVRLRGVWDESRCTVGGALHGGFLMSLADCAAAACASFNLPEGAGTTTIEAKTNFMRAVREGSVTAIARPIHVGGTTIVLQTDVLRDDGELVTRTTQTQAVLRP
jgi:uncharacterized protein (TIGR00369 family)